MYCRNCNRQFPNDAAFCDVCGSALEAPAVSVQGTAFQEFHADQEGVQYVSVKPRSKKKIIAIVLASVLSVALIVGLICYLVMISNPLYKISNALNNSLDELLVNTPHLAGVRENITELINDRSFTAKLDFVDSTDWSDGDSMKSSYQIELNYNAGSEEMSGKASVSEYEKWYGEVSSKSYDIAFSADADDIYARIKQLGREIYALPLSNFGEEYRGSAMSKMVEEDDLDDFLENAEFNPYADISFSAFRKTEEGEEFIDSLKIEESDKKIPHTKDLTVYSLQIRQDDLADALVAYYEFALTELCGEEAVKALDFPEANSSNSVVYIYLGINDDDCLVALYAYPKGNKDEAITLLLDGNDNIWDEVVLYEGEHKQTIFVEQKKDGFEVYLQHSDSSPEKLLEVDDDEQELIAYDSGTTYKLTYSDADDGATFEFTSKYSSEYSNASTDFELIVLPIQDIEMLDGDPVAILDMKKSKLKDLLEKLDDIF